MKCLEDLQQLFLKSHVLSARKKKRKKKPEKNVSRPDLADSSSVQLHRAICRGSRSKQGHAHKASPRPCAEPSHTTEFWPPVGWSMLGGMLRCRNRVWPAALQVHPWGPQLLDSHGEHCLWGDLESICPPSQVPDQAQEHLDASRKKTETWTEAAWTLGRDGDCRKATAGLPRKVSFLTSAFPRWSPLKVLGQHREKGTPVLTPAWDTPDSHFGPRLGDPGVQHCRLAPTLSQPRSRAFSHPWYEPWQHPVLGMLGSCQKLLGTTEATANSTPTCSSSCQRLPLPCLQPPSQPEPFPQHGWRHQRAPVCPEASALVTQLGTRGGLGVFRQVQNG